MGKPRFTVHWNDPGGELASMYFCIVRHERDRHARFFFLRHSVVPSPLAVVGVSIPRCSQCTAIFGYVWDTASNSIYHFF